MVIKICVIAIGGVIGTLLRYGISYSINKFLGPGFPLGTLVVNLLGCFVIGYITTLVIERGLFSSNFRDFILIGACGSLTTFSTYIFESIILLQKRALILASMNIIGSIILGLIVFWIGSVLAKLT